MLQARVKAFQQQHGLSPTLAILRVGNDEAAAGYARAIARNCKSIDVGFHTEELPAEAAQATVTAVLQRLSADNTIHGIMILSRYRPRSMAQHCFKN
ncbi:MAG: tetrahydrofolate dehydrogenase/cyclohydrolase catalytic domain-containing protein [Caldilineaceae bacterium]